MSEAKLIDELVLFGIDRHGHHQVQYTTFGYFLGGASLVDLAILRRIDVHDDRIRLLDRSPTGHPVLDDALSRMAAAVPRDRSARIIKVIAGTARRETLTHLVDTGVLRRESQRVLAVFHRNRYELTGWVPDPVADARARMHAAVLGAEPVSARTAAACSFVAGLGWHNRVLPDLAGRALRGRMREIGRSTWGPAYVQKALDAVSAVTTAGHLG